MIVKVMQKYQNKTKTVWIESLFFPGKIVIKLYPSYMQVIAHFTNSLKINFLSRLTYSLLSVLNFFQV